VADVYQDDFYREERSDDFTEKSREPWLQRGKQAQQFTLEKQGTVAGEIFSPRFNHQRSHPLLASRTGNSVWLVDYWHLTGSLVGFMVAGANLRHTIYWRKTHHVRADEVRRGEARRGRGSQRQERCTNVTR